MRRAAPFARLPYHTLALHHVHRRKVCPYASVFAALRRSASNLSELLRSDAAAGAAARHLALKVQANATCLPLLGCARFDGALLS